MFSVFRKIAAAMCPFFLAAVCTPVAMGQDQKPRVDFLGDPLPDGALGRHGTIRWRYPGHARTLNFTPDSKSVLAFGDDVTLRMWDAATGKMQWSFGYECRPPGSDEFFDQLRIDSVMWRVALVGPQLSTFYASMGSYSADGKSLALIDAERNVVILDTKTGKRKRSVKCDAGTGPIALSPDGKLLAIYVEQRVPPAVRIWDMESTKEWPPLVVPHRGSIIKLAFSNDRKHLAYVITDPYEKEERRDQIHLWNLIARKYSVLGDGKTERLNDFSFARDGGLLAAAGANGSLFIWETATGNEIRRVVNGKVEYWRIAITPNARTIVTVESLLRQSTLAVFDLETGNKTILLTVSSEIDAIGVSPDGRAVAGAFANGSIRIWDLTTKKERLPTSKNEKLRGFGIRDGGRTLVLWTATGRVRFVESLSGLENHSTTGPAAGHSFFALAPDGSTALVANEEENGPMFLWDGLRGTSTLKLDDKVSQVFAASFSSDGKSLLTIGFEAKLRNAVTGKKILEISDVAAEGCAISPDNRLLAISTGPNELGLFESQGGKQRIRLETGIRDRTVIRAIEFSPDGRLLSTSADDVVRLYDVVSGRSVQGFVGMAGVVTSIAFSPKGDFIAAGGSDRTVRVWNIENGQETHCFKGHFGDVVKLAWSDDGKMLISAATDDCVLVWDTVSFPKRRANQPAPQKLDRCWADLASSDAKIAFQGIGEMIGQPKEAVAFLATKLQPVPEIDAALIEKLVADLDSDNFNKRTKATKELETIDTQARPALEKMLAKPPSAEARNRAKNLLDKLDGAIPSQEELRVYRAVEVLERIGDAEARELLARLAKGAPATRMTIEAKSSLARLMKK